MAVALGILDASPTIASGNGGLLLYSLNDYGQRHQLADKIDSPLLQDREGKAWIGGAGGTGTYSKGMSLGGVYCSHKQCTVEQMATTRKNRLDQWMQKMHIDVLK